MLSFFDVCDLFLLFLLVLDFFFPHKRFQSSGV